MGVFTVQPLSVRRNGPRQGRVQPQGSCRVRQDCCGLLVIEINPEAGPISARADLLLQGANGKVLPALLHAMQRPGWRGNAGARRGASHCYGAGGQTMRPLSTEVVQVCSPTRSANGKAPVPDWRCNTNA